MTQAVRAELRPDECVILFNPAYTGSEDIARYYAAKRSVPGDQIFGIALPLGETLARSRYEKDVVPGLRRFLKGNKFGSRIRCVVTCHGVPLKVNAPVFDQTAAAHLRSVKAELSRTVDRLERLVDEIQRSAVSIALEPRSPYAPDGGTREVSQDEMRRLYTRYRAAQQLHAQSLRDAKGEIDRAGAERVLQFVGRAEGKLGLLQHAMQDRASIAPEAFERLQKVSRRISAEAVELDASTGPRSSVDVFKDRLPRVREMFGLFGLAKRLFLCIDAYQGRDTESSFDSELSLALWDGYPLTRWQPNTLNPTVVREPSESQSRTLMVGRIDGPTPKIVRRMIDDAIATERVGLKGTVYVDARGLTANDGYLKGDKDLIQFAEMVQRFTDLPVVLDRRESLFQPGDCPNVAIYCGWYSLGQYVDAFDFVPGAVAAHLASFELVKLRDPSDPYWCKELLKDGVCATFGAVAEPYLEGFPSPTRFFGSVLSGRYTLVEAFYRCKPCNSWRLSLLGDPLYNPFKNNPQPKLIEMYESAMK